MFSFDLKKSNNQIIALAGTLILFLILNATLRDGNLNFVPTIVAVLIVVEIFIFVGMEAKQGAEKHGWKHEIVDTVIALVIAVAIWYGASFVLNTSSPISGVVSCSMLSNLYRGDFVIVQGAPVKGIELNLTKAELDAITGNKATIKLAGSSNNDSINQSNVEIDGSIFPYCIFGSNRNSELCQVFVQNPEQITETKGPFTYRYEKCTYDLSNGTRLYEPCLKSVEYAGKQYLTNFSNDIIVYQPQPSDVYARVGDIVHRTMFVLNVDGKKYYLTRGDNNPLLDAQVYDYVTGQVNKPIPQERARGKVIARIPWLGYFKLFISGYLQEDPQCKTQLGFTHN